MQYKIDLKKTAQGIEHLIVPTWRLTCNMHDNANIAVIKNPC